MHRRRPPVRLDHLGLRNLHTWLGSHDPLRLTVRAVGADGERLRERKLREFLTAEVKLADNELYVLAEGSWFAVDVETANQLRRDLAEIRELRRDWMPPWWANHHEDTYNEEVAERSGWRLLDKKNFRGVVRNRDLIEVRDLLTPEMDLVCVKRLRNAAGISHLFAQGAVSATLYRADRDYREHVERLFREWWTSMRPPATPRVVYAIAFDGSGSVLERLPFFSRIDLRNQAKVVRAAGFRVALCPIRITRLRHRWRRLSRPCNAELRSRSRRDKGSCSASSEAQLKSARRAPQRHSALAQPFRLSSSRATERRCTSSGPSAIRSARAQA